MLYATCARIIHSKMCITVDDCSTATLGLAGRSSGCRVPGIFRYDIGLVVWAFNKETEKALETLAILYESYEQVNSESGRH